MAVVGEGEPPVIGKVAGAAVITRIQAATLRRGVTAQDGIERTAMRLRHPCAILVQIAGSVTSNDVSQVHRRRGAIC